MGRKDERKEVSYRVLRKQNIYNGELQGAIYSINTARSNTTRNIKTNNRAVIILEKKITKRKYIQWNKLPEPELARLMKERIE